MSRPMAKPLIGSEPHKIHFRARGQSCTGESLLVGGGGDARGIGVGDAVYDVVEICVFPIIV